MTRFNQELVRIRSRWTTLFVLVVAAASFAFPALQTGFGLEPSGNNTPEIATPGFAGTAPSGFPAECGPAGSYGEITVLNPLEDTLFPSDIAAPLFEWRDDSDPVDHWIVTVRFMDDNVRPLRFFCSEARWTPDREIWERIKMRSMDSSVRVTIWGYAQGRADAAVSRGTVRIMTSRDAVDAPVLFRRVPPSFSYAERHPEVMEWCLADVASYEPPPVIMSGQPVCGSCHSFSSGADVMGMDMDYGGDKGSYFLGGTGETMRLDAGDFISWNDLPRKDGLRSTGLLSRVSPDGEYVASTANDISFLAKISDPYCSQLFFPIQGKLALYSRRTGAMKRLPTGGEEIDVVETDPSWSPDGRYLLFARARMTRDLYRELGGDTIFNAGNEGIDELNREYPVRFDVYSLPFNAGAGGTAVPLPGAGDNGGSNYFARVSPDGRWVVFTRSRTGLVLQPDSRLWIVPSGGGRSRILHCNRSRMNSWHTWSPNGRWLAFVSKENMPYAELFLTHIDDSGRDSVPVRLARFNKPGYAVNVPEFVNMRPGGIRSMSLMERSNEGAAAYAVDAAKH